MKVLIILLTVFVLSLAGTKLFAGDWDLILSGNIAMSAMLLFTAIGHFAYSKGMSMMLPETIPLKKELVYLTGIIEIAAAAGLLLASLRHITALLLIIFFILILPSNIYAAIKKVDLEKASYEGSGTGYLWFRVPLQILFIVWVYYFSYR